jgi:hypothetical protein
VVFASRAPRKHELTHPATIDLSVDGGDSKIRDRVRVCGVALGDNGDGQATLTRRARFELELLNKIPLGSGRKLLDASLAVYAQLRKSSSPLAKVCDARNFIPLI